MRKVGRSILYSLNKEHILVDEILAPLFKKEQKLFLSLTRAILAPLSGPKPISMILYGSQIDEKRVRPDSDFDILCIIPDKTNVKKFKGEISRSEAQIERKFGNRLSRYNRILCMKEKSVSYIETPNSTRTRLGPKGYAHEQDYRKNGKRSNDFGIGVGT
jgi:hypothetical protein